MNMVIAINGNKQVVHCFNGKPEDLPIYKEKNPSLSFYYTEVPEDLAGLLYNSETNSFTPDPSYIPPVPYEPSQDEIDALIISEVISSTQLRLDNWARQKNYDGILSLCSYATSTLPSFAAEGAHGVQKRDITWATLYSYMAEVKAGTKPRPNTVDDVIAILPELTW